MTTIEELIQSEDQERARRRKKRIAWLLILTPIILIATCNYYVNTHQENAILENPEPGDYFVFKGLIGTGDQPFKLKAIENDSLEFFIPKYEFINFQSHSSERKVYDLDNKGELYEPGLTIKISKASIDKYRKNTEFSTIISGTNGNVFLQSVFGRVRGNAIDSTLKKYVGKDSTNK